MPNEDLVVLCEYLVIEALFRLRLTCRRLRQVDDQGSCLNCGMEVMLYRAGYSVGMRLDNVYRDMSPLIENGNARFSELKFADQAETSTIPLPRRISLMGITEKFPIYFLKNQSWIPGG